MHIFELINPALWFLIISSALPTLCYNPDTPMKPETEIPNCGQTVALFKEKIFYLNSTIVEQGELGFYPPNMNCKWDFIGSAECTAEVSCSLLEIKKGNYGECDLEYFAISDGTGGSEKFCGRRSQIRPRKPSKGLRDLYLSFKSSNQISTRKGFECIVQCTSNREMKTPVARELKIRVKRRENPKCRCGATKWAAPKRRKRVVEGPAAPTNEFPWQVAIVTPGTKTAYCGGSIINEQYILTAAHCFAVRRLTLNDAEVLVYAKKLDPADKEDLVDRIPPVDAIEDYKKKLEELKELEVQKLKDADAKKLVESKKPKIDGKMVPTDPKNITADPNIEKPKIPADPKKAAGDPNIKKPKMPTDPNIKKPKIPADPKKAAVGADKKKTIESAGIGRNAKLDPKKSEIDSKPSTSKRKDPLKIFGPSVTPAYSIWSNAFQNFSTFKDDGDEDESDSEPKDKNQKKRRKQRSPAGEQRKSYKVAEKKKASKKEEDEDDGIDETPKPERKSTIKFSDVSDDKEEEQYIERFKVTEMHTHPLFSRGYDFDVSVLKLDKKINLNLDPKDNPQAVCLPKVGYKEAYEGTTPFVSGWGLENENATSSSGILRLLKVPVIPSPLCQSWNRYEISPRMLCAGYEKGQKDACTGDSGGPLSLRKDSGQWEQIGIVSWGEGCARPKKPGVYARVTELIQWVYRHTFEDSLWCTMELEVSED